MINNLTLTAVHSQITDKEKAYARKKIGALEKFMPLRARISTKIEVKLKQGKSKDKNDHECEVIIKLPKGNVTSHRKSTNFMTAIDEVEENLKKQLKVYKDKHSEGRITRKVVARVKRRLVKTQPAEIEE